MAAVKELLLERLNDLTKQELNDFTWFLQFTFFQQSIQHNVWKPLQNANCVDELTDVLVETCGQKCVEVTMTILMDMNRTDLVQRLSESSSGLKGEKKKTTVTQP